ncbi:hypothetical protein MLD38_019823 [Melastoma candidum]|uniref:Uncharacterized protein n=1 Tax=Melastoma candidum TaxID=119954 RepID=A0ACB9QBC8_9MYRT|nr:hypothetical protein MLD38_019823 [Melastoma candidum]
MSFAAYKMMHWPTGIEHCSSGYITHSPSDFTPSPNLDSDFPSPRGILPLPNLIVTTANVLEVYVVRVQEDVPKDSPSSSEPKRGGLMDNVSGVSLDLVCHYRLHGNVESMAVLSTSGGSTSRSRDSIILAFRDAKISVLEFDDSVHGLCATSMHCFEGPNWLHLKRGRECFAVGPSVKVDPQGRCGGVLVYDSQMIVLKAAQAGSGLVVDEDSFGAGTALNTRVESSYIINLRDLEMKHVKDFVFVHGYIEPVMVVLHEVELTWAGRTAWKHHTCMISALSISTTLKQHPLIWSASNLPSDSYKLLAVPSPIGGVLVISANVIHYHSQSASCSLALNHFAVPAEGSQEMPKSSFSVELDGANSAWLLNNVVLLSTKTGDLLLLSLVFDGRIVQRLDLSKSKASVLTSGISTLGTSLFFLGSRLGDSLLVQYTCVGTSRSSSGLKEEFGDIEADAPSSKRLRRSPSDALQDMVSGEELSFHGSAASNSESSQKTFSFAVRDSFLNVGPLKDFAYGLRMNSDANATGIAKQSNYELVCCSGHGKNGALCVLWQSVRPDAITEVELPGCKGIWTVYHKNSRSSDSAKFVVDDEEYHAYLIISMENRTMVLETGELLAEVTESVDYYVQGRTVAAGNLFGRRRVIQVFEHGLRVLNGSSMTQELSLAAPNPEPSSESCLVSTVSIADPYVLLKMSDGSIRLLGGDPLTCTISVISPASFHSSNFSVSACTLYHDKGLEPWLRKARMDAWLTTVVDGTGDGVDGVPQEQGDTYCVVCYENGSLEIFDVPNFSCVYTVDKFVSGKMHIIDEFMQEPKHQSHKESLKSSDETASQQRKENLQPFKVVELAMYRWSGQHSRPYLFGILNDGTILSYQAYIFEGSEANVKSENAVSNDRYTKKGIDSASRLRNLRFVRVPLDMYTREEATGENPSNRITTFNNIGGYQGLFLCGSRPSWFMVIRDRLRVHPQLCDRTIVAFTVLHNVNCNHGLIYVTSQGILKICQLPTDSSYDNYWPVQKVPLKGTPHQVTYFAEKNLYPVIISVPVQRPLNQVLSSLVDQEATHQFENQSVSPDEVHQTYTVEEFEVRILEQEKSGGPWLTRATIPMQNSENALTVRVVTLFNTTTRENETVLAVGTAYVQGEDVAARGRILLFSVAKSADNSQVVATEVYSKELKGAISAVASLQGQLLIASGPKIILHKWSGVELNGVAFYDAPPLHVVSLNVVKNFILLGDIHKSIYFLSWKEQGAQLNLLAKDFGSLDCFATEFLIDGSTLSLVVSDEQKNIQVFYYAPKMSESWKGQKLLSRAEFHVGAHITKFLRLQMLPSTSGQTSGSVVSDKTNRFALLFGTLDGSIGCVAPLDELTFRRLQSLQKKLVDAVPHVAGLNPKSFRQFRSCGRAHRPGPDSIVDCELLSDYEMLSLDEQLGIAQQIGTTRSQILSNLNDLTQGTSFL